MSDPMEFVELRRASDSPEDKALMTYSTESRNDLRVNASYIYPLTIFIINAF